MLQRTRSEEERQNAVKVHKETVNGLITLLNDEWSLRLPLLQGHESPRSRRDRGSLERECVTHMVFLQYKDVIALSAALKQYKEQARILYSRWVHKPKGERIVPSATRQVPKPIMEEERKELVACLRELLDARSGPLKTPSKLSFSERFDDAPIASPRLPKPKRASNEGFEDVSSAKKAKSRAAGKENAMPPPPLINRRSTAQSFIPDVSFTSAGSDTIFSRVNSNFHASTQTTTPDEDGQSTNPNSPLASLAQPNYRISSSQTNSSQPDFGSSSFDAEAHAKAHAKLDRASEDPEEYAFNKAKLAVGTSELCAKLQCTFPTVPNHLRHLPMPILYELTRIELHTGVSMSGFGNSRWSSTTKYKSFWASLRNNSRLRAVELPPMSDEDAWTSSMGNVRNTDHVVVYSGSIAYVDGSQSVFMFRLEPLRFDKSHRLDRSLGSDRFFELDTPFVTGGKSLSPFEQHGANGKAVFFSWLADISHQLFGRDWKSFHQKPKERKGRKWHRSQSVEEYDTGHRVYLFATSGRNIRDDQEMSICELLDYIRPIAENKDEKYLKLFARTDLAVSRNTAALVFEREQMHFISDIKNSYTAVVDGVIKDRSEEMTDGAGQISCEAAKLVAEKMNLTFLPCAFQARIGEAKGLWSIGPSSETGIWIKITDSQTKWKLPDTVRKRDRICYRTFEVLRYSSPLKPADLNMQFLPILNERAIDKLTVRANLKALMKEGLETSLAELEKAIATPQTCRAWLKKSSSNAGRIKNQSVAYRAGLPITLEERAILLLDVGFDPRKQAFVGNILQKLFKAQCDDLKKRLNITVYKSTYAYMVPDWTGTLEEGEVFINFSNFNDKSTGVQNARPILNGVDVLVARSPAHYASDVQKVRAVFKVELLHLVDVIVFSTKGRCLAAKLSGGDYDGDIAWTCWEPTIVDNFQNAETVEPPDLVKEGFIGKDDTTYAELTRDKINPISCYLNAALEFNMRPKMLGKCTNFKEEYCYMKQSISSRQAVCLSTLLSNLVDQAKQGYEFSAEHWIHFSQTLIGESTRKPAYKTDHISSRSTDITDQISRAADAIIESTRAKVYELIGKSAVQWDLDLVKMFKHAEKTSEEEEEWKVLLADLLADIKAFRDEWSSSFYGSDDDNNKFLAKIDVFYERLLTIKPHTQNALTKSLLPDYLHEDITPWALLRASALFATHPRSKQRESSAFLWNLCGRQLAKLKADANGVSHTVASGMYWILKPDAAMAKHMIMEQEVDDNLSVVNADDIPDLED